MGHAATSLVTAFYPPLDNTCYSLLVIQIIDTICLSIHSPQRIWVGRNRPIREESKIDPSSHTQK